MLGEEPTMTNSPSQEFMARYENFLSGFDALPKEEKEAAMERFTDELDRTGEAPDWHDLGMIAEEAEARLRAALKADDSEPIQIDGVDLEDPVEIDLRQFKFTAEMQGVMLQYRDERTSLSNDEYLGALSAMNDGLEKIKTGTNNLNRHLVVKLAFDPQIRRKDIESIEKIKRMIERYESTFGKDASPSGRNDYHKVWREFVFTSVLVFARRYGIAFADQIEKLTFLKSGQKLKGFLLSEPDKSTSTPLHHIKSVLRVSLKTAQKQAEVECWPTLSVLKIFIESRTPQNQQLHRRAADPGREERSSPQATELQRVMSRTWVADL